MLPTYSLGRQDNHGGSDGLFCDLTDRSGPVGVHYYVTPDDVSERPALVAEVPVAPVQTRQWRGLEDHRDHSDLPWSQVGDIDLVAGRGQFSRTLDQLELEYMENSLINLIVLTLFQRSGEERNWIAVIYLNFCLKF